MLQNYIKEIVRVRRLRKVARDARNGIVTRGTTEKEVMEALHLTRPKNFVEMFGLLSVRTFRPDGTLKQDLGLQSVRKVTLAFVKLLADAFVTSTIAANFDHFIYHACGDGSAAEASGDTLLGSEKGLRVTGSQTHGTTSNIFKTIKTYVASNAFTAIEHGLFDTVATSSGTLLDRSLVTTPPTLATGDEVEFTYNLTINTET